MTYARTLPVLDEDNTFYWTCGESDVLKILQCNHCLKYVHPPVPVCPDCLQMSVEPVAVSGKGVIDTFTINYQSWGKDMSVPYVIAIVQLNEQEDLKLTTNIVNIDPLDVRMGMPVTVTFEQDEDVWIPLFKPE